MLALTRKSGESIMLDEDIEIVVVEIKGDQVRLGIKAPKSVRILRKEIFLEIQDENKNAANTAISIEENQVNELRTMMRNLKKPEKT